MSASLTNSDGTTLFTSQHESPLTGITYVNVHVLGQGIVGAAYWSPELLQWRHAGRGYGDLHTLMRDLATGLEH